MTPPWPELSFSPDGRVLSVLRGGDPSAVLFDVASGKEVGTAGPPATPGDDPASVRHRAWPGMPGVVLTTGGRAVVWETPETLGVYELGSNRRLGGVEAGPARAAVPSPDGRLFATVDAGGTARVWEMRTLKERLALPVEGVTLPAGDDPRKDGHRPGIPGCAARRVRWPSRPTAGYPPGRPRTGPCGWPTRPPARC